MAGRSLTPLIQVLPLLAMLGGAVSCRDESERARAGVLQLGYRFTIGDFLKAAAAGEGNVVSRFLLAGMQVNAAGTGGESALRLAAAGGHPFVVRQLLAAGADVDQADLRGVTPLMAAAAAGDEISVRTLRESGADLSRQDAEGRTALAAAAAAGRAAVVEWLVPRTEGAIEPMLLLACQGGHTGVIDGLLNAEREPGAAPPDWKALLKAAAEGGHLPAVRILSRRLPPGEDAVMIHHEAAAVARQAGQEIVAGFLEEEAGEAGSRRTAAISAPADLPESASSPLPLAAELPSSQAVAGRGDGDPQSLPAGMKKPAPRRLDGRRFPDLNCNSLPEAAERIRMVSWEARVWPVILKDVADGHGSAEILITEAPARTVRVRVGEDIPGTGCVVETLRRRRLYTDSSETELRNASEMQFRRVATGEVFKTGADVPVLSNDSTAVLLLPGDHQEWGAVAGDEFRLGSLLLRVKEIAKKEIVLESRLTREEVRVHLTGRP